MKQTQRHNGIIELVKQQGYVSTEVAQSATRKKRAFCCNWL